MIDRLDEIVDEVLRRVKLYLASKKVLLVLRDDSDFMEVKYLAEILEDKGYTIQVLSLLSKDIKVLEWNCFKNKESIRTAIFKEKTYENFMSEFHGMLISDLSCDESQNYEKLRFPETLGKLIFETIKENKPVYALSREMTGVKNDYLKEKINEMKIELEKMKIHLLTEKASKRITVREEPEEKIVEADERSVTKGRTGSPILHHKFITLADVLSLSGHEEIKISESTRLTMEASDYLNRQGIRVKKLHKRI